MERFPDFARVTELAAIAAAKWKGRGEAKLADKAAVDVMRLALNELDFRGEVVVGEGGKDQSYELYIGERFGRGNGPVLDIAVDPLECTSSVAYGRPNALTVIAAAPQGALYRGIDSYMEKIAVGPEAAEVIDLDLPVAENLKRVAEALGKDISEITVAVLDRPRHEKLIAEIRQAGARIELFTDGDVAMAIATCLKESPIDVMMGVGGSTEAVLAAAALKCYGGEMLCRWQAKPEQLPKLQELGIDIQKKLKVADLVKSEEVMFAATGVVSGPLLDGVITEPHKIITHTLIASAKNKNVSYVRKEHLTGQLHPHSHFINHMKQPMLYILPFDHRGSFMKMFGFEEKTLTAEQVEKLKSYKMVIYEGMLEALKMGAPKDKAAILVDEQFGSEIHKAARSADLARILTTEKSGQDEFDFEYGDKFGEHIERLAPAYVKALVRYNPAGDQVMNQRQTARLKKLNDWCKTKGYKFLFELLAIPTKEQLAQCGNSKDEYEKKMQAKVVAAGIAELQADGVEPDIWKLEGLENPEDMRMVAKQARSNGRTNVGIVVLGRGESEEKVLKWLKASANIEGVVGFAVGRTVFSAPLQKYHKGEISREEAIKEIAKNYKKFVDLFEEVKKGV
jgi:fructose-1,6-bisphosphatase II